MDLDDNCWDEPYVPGEDTGVAVADADTDDDEDSWDEPEIPAAPASATPASSTLASAPATSSSSSSGARPSKAQKFNTDDSIATDRNRSALLCHRHRQEGVTFSCLSTLPHALHTELRDAFWTVEREKARTLLLALLPDPPVRICGVAMCPSCFTCLLHIDKSKLRTAAAKRLELLAEMTVDWAKDEEEQQRKALIENNVVRSSF